MCHNKRESVNIPSLLLPPFFVPLPAPCSFQTAFTYLFLYAVQLHCIPTKVSTVNSPATQKPPTPPTDSTAQKASGLQMSCVPRDLTARADSFTPGSSPLPCKRLRHCSTCWPGVWSRRRPLLGSRPLQTPPRGPPGSRRWGSKKKMQFLLRCSFKEENKMGGCGTAKHSGDSCCLRASIPVDWH